MRLVIITIMAAGVALSPTYFFSQENTSTAEQKIRCIPIRALLSSGAPKGFVWVHAQVIKADDEDTVTIEDSSGKILLFLPTDELIAQHPPLGSNLYVLGKVDVSPINPNKNEFYAERILFAEKQHKEAP